MKAACHPTQVLAQGLAWPESPRWHQGALWFSDVHNFRLMRVVPGEEAQVVAHVPGRPAGLGFMPDGRPLLATALDSKLWWVGADGGLTLAADLSGSVKGLLNDMVVDASGRAWVGDTGFDLLKGEPVAPGALLSWREDEGIRLAAPEVSFPNGIAIDAAHRTLYLAETFGQCVSAFDLARDGALSRRRVHATLQGRPDGMCLDIEGGLWVALLWDQAFHRVAATGEVTDTIVLDGERAISCVLGGPLRDVLFLGVARVDDSDPHDVRREGRLRSCAVPIRGAGTPR